MASQMGSKDALLDTILPPLRVGIWKNVKWGSLPGAPRAAQNDPGAIMKPPRRLEMPPTRDLDVIFPDFSEIFASLLASVLNSFLDHCSHAVKRLFNGFLWSDFGIGFLESN